MNRIEITGKRFARLTVQWPAGRGATCARGGTSRHPEIHWLCLCDCGQLAIVKGSHIRSGTAESCGCKKIRHGHTVNYKCSPTWVTWKAMRDRCSEPSHKSYPRYGGRGIRVCERWDSFELFLANVGMRPEGKSLDRWPNPDGNYEPGNVRWATAKQQRVNRGERVDA